MDKGKKVIVKSLFELAKEESNKTVQSQYIKAMGTLIKNENEDIDLKTK